MKKIKLLIAIIAVISIIGCQSVDVKKEEKEINKKAVLSEMKTLLSKKNIASFTSKKTKAEPVFKIIKSDEQAIVIYRCRFIKSRSLINALESIISPSGTVEELEEQNFILINDISAKTAEIKNVILSLDVQIPQIVVEAKIVEVLINDEMEREVGLEYEKYDANHRRVDSSGNVSGGLSSGSINLSSPASNPLTGQGGMMDFLPYFSGKIDKYTTFRTFIRWLETSREARILSSPNLAVNLGTTASIVTGEDIPIQSSQVNSGTVSTSIDFKRIGVSLNVTPVLINKDNVKLQINPEVSSVVRTETFIQNGVTINNPIIAVRNIDTELTIGDGEIIMLGGLYSSEKIKNLREVPYLSAIPILGNLFKSVNYSEARTQLVFLLKINILPFEDDIKIFDIETSAEELEKVGDIIINPKKIFPKKEKNKDK